MTRLGRVLMVQGTTSNAGKSFLTAALLRWFRRRGLAVAPFKAQNMALNAAVTPEGLEIGRAQAEQATAAGIPPHVDMNPILLKPEGSFRSQVIVHGRPIGHLSYEGYGARKAELRTLVLESLERLRRDFDLVVIEGAGSPAEINLRSGDLVNMFIARSVRAPVLLVTDIDRGGAYAALYGTWALLEPDDRELLRGFVMNRIRGDPTLLESGYRELLERTGVPTLGAVPYLPNYHSAEEDSLGLDARRHRPRALLDQTEITVVDIPHLSNYDEFRVLERIATVRFASNPREGIGTDLLVLPGSKCTQDDLQWLRTSGWDRVLGERARLGKPILGICGGCQMLGRGLTEDGIRIEGLGLLEIETYFRREKRTTRVATQVLGLPAADDTVIEGYEIHHGRVHAEPNTQPFSKIHEGREGRRDGAVFGAVRGTMIHGLFEDPRGARALIEWVRPVDAGALPAVPPLDVHDQAADALEDLQLQRWCRDNLGLDGLDG